MFSTTSQLTTVSYTLGNGISVSTTQLFNSTQNLKTQRFLVSNEMFLANFYLRF